MCCRAIKNYENLIPIKIPHLDEKSEEHMTISERNEFIENCFLDLKMKLSEDNDVDRIERNAWRAYQYQRSEGKSIQEAGTHAVHQFRYDIQKLCDGKPDPFYFMLNLLNKSMYNDIYSIESAIYQERSRYGVLSKI